MISLKDIYPKMNERLGEKEYYFVSLEEQKELADSS